MTLTATQSRPAKLTPMMEQYMATKQAHADCLLFYRMGDFYELFFEDAVIAADILNIALTTRGKHLGEDIPMCGVPHHSSENYLLNLIRSGHRIAICEQMESPAEAKKRGYKAVVRREVIRIVTPGTITEEALLDSSDANYLVALTMERKQLALAWVDISTGELLSTVTDASQLLNDLARIQPKELLINETLYQSNALADILEPYRSILMPYSSSIFSPSRGENRLKTFYNVNNLGAYGSFSKSEIGVIGALLEYVELTQKGNNPYINPPKQYHQQQFLAIDAATRKNLEIHESLSGNKKQSLYGVINKTVTPSGARLLKQYLATPLCFASGINERLDMVEFLLRQAELRQHLRQCLKSMPDMERSLSRLILGRGGPRDLWHIHLGLGEVIKIAELLEFCNAPLPRGLMELHGKLNPNHDYHSLLEEALRNDQPLPVLSRDGGFINPEYHPRIKELLELQHNSTQALQQLKERYKQQTGVSSLKVTRNNVIGYFVEVPTAQSSKIDLELFTHKQSTLNAVRYTTKELQQLEEDIVTATDKILNLELSIFAMLLDQLQEIADHIALTAQAMASLDVMTSLAELADQHHYCRPQIDDSNAFIIEQGRHPVVEQNITGEMEGSFVDNDCNLSDQQRLWLLTGPNMAGKSTFLRQNALIVILAQMGSFVPAHHAHIGTIDKLFSRIGASDDLARGRSTFMVEMSETATILHQATPKSFVILDEIGRGTATYDGLAIAWSVLEYLHHHNASRGLFATHYHELTNLADQLKHLVAYTVQVREWEDKIIFLHKVIKGAAEKSYGIHVGKLAGLPQSVIKRADQLLAQISKEPLNPTQELPLFASDNASATHQPAPETQIVSDVEQRLGNLTLDELSPKEALEILYELQELL